MKDFIDENKYKEYYDFIDFIMNIAIESQKYEIAAWIRVVKKELAYSVVFEEDLNIEDFVSLITKNMERLDEEDKNIVMPHLRDLKLKMLNI